MRIVPHVGQRKIWITEAGVEQQNGQEATPLAHTHCKYPLKGACKLQELAAKDFLQLGGVSDKYGKRHIKRVYYSLYKGPGPNKKHLFDSALLEGEGSEPGDWRPAYCVLAFVITTAQRGQALMPRFQAREPRARLQYWRPSIREDWLQIIG